MAFPSRAVGVLAAAAAGIIWSMSGPVSRELTDLGIDSTQTTCMRFMVVTMVAIVFICTRERDNLKVDRGSFYILLMTALIGTVVHSVCYLAAMNTISIGLACLLEFINPSVVILLSVPILHEKLTKTKGISVVIAFIGCTLCMELISNPGAFSTVGIILGLMSGVFFAIHTVGIKIAATRGVSTMVILFYTSVISCLVLIPFCDIPSVFSILVSDSYALFLVLSLGILLTLVPSFLFTYSMKHIEAGLAAVITFIEPIAAAVLGFLLYGEPMGVESITGAGLILLALIIVNRPDLSEKDAKVEMSD